MNLTASPSSRVAACAALVLLLPALAGCSLEIVNSGDSAPEKSQGANAEGSDAPDRNAFDTMVSQTLSCTSGSVDVDAAGGVVKVEGDCADLRVSSAGVVVLAGSTTLVTIDGTGNTVFVDTAESIDLAGTGNTVVWSEGTPDVADSGVGNTAAPSRG